MAQSRPLAPPDGTLDKGCGSESHMGKHVQTIGDGWQTAWTITHGAHTRDVVVEVYRTQPPHETVEADVSRPSEDTVYIETNRPVQPDEFTVVVLW
jgi:hypothetical protein